MIKIKTNLYSKILAFIGLNLFYLPAISADYVGTDQCVDCHQTQFKAWQGSDHDMSMHHAKPDAVLGDFNDANIIFQNK